MYYTQYLYIYDNFSIFICQIIVFPCTIDRYLERMNMLITVHTADGMLTKATPKIPPGKRARKITISSERLGEIIISVSPNIIITFDNDKEKLFSIVLSSKSNRTGWWGSAWLVTDTEDWKNEQYIIKERDAVIAASYTEAVVEHLRYILNKELCIRPIVSEHVCLELANVMNGKQSQSTFVGARKKMNE